MPLFGDPLEKARAQVKDAIRGLGGDADRAVAGADTWLVGKGSASVLVRLVPRSAEHASAFLQIVSPVMRAPAGPGLHERLARLNFEMGGLASFCVTPGNEVHLTCARTIEGLTSHEVAQLVAQVAHFSDLYDDKLLGEFGRELALRPRR